MNNYNHPIVLNIKDKKKEVTEINTEPKTITKLAIGKPGGADFTGEEWEQILEVKCLICKKSFEYEKDPEIKSLVTSVLNASSENQKDDIKAWEMEIFPCEHTLTLVQSEGIKIAEKSIAKCNDCDLSSNLWLCLTCGNLSCGRKETGGNQHAIAHYNKTKHPLVVKTGTITPDGEASLYCYACDNDVKDENLAQHLQNLGIDINTQKKTDKTVTEMNLSININFTLSKTIEEGKILTPLYGPGFTGLENLGNSCYMNSVLQILFSLEPFKKAYFDKALEHLNTCTKNAYECYLCQMSKIMYGLHSGIYSQKKTRHLPATEENKEGEIEEYQDGIRPSSFKLYFGKGSEIFSSNKQQDALEYLNYLMEKMKKEEKALNKFNPLELFEFDIQTRMECNSCHQVKYRSTRSWFLSLSVEDWKNKKEETAKCTMDEVLSKFLAPEILELDCPNCKKKSEWTKTQKVMNYPKYLIIVFQRFVFDWVPVKLEVSFEPILDNFDLKLLSREHKKENEIIIDTTKEELAENEEVEEEIKFNQEHVNYLLQSGIPELGAKWALYLSGNDPEAALMLYVENSDNPDYKKPLPKVKVKKNKNNKDGEDNVDQNLVENLINMGFEKKKAIAALKLCNGNVNNAVEALFSNPNLGEDDNDVNMEEKKEEKMDLVDDKNINDGNGSLYNLYGYITHLGKNTDHGHYVCHIRQEGNKWTYFNDSKVTLWEEPPIRKGYIYIYRNNTNEKK